MDDGYKPVHSGVVTPVPSPAFQRTKNEFLRRGTGTGTFFAIAEISEFRCERRIVPRSVFSNAVAQLEEKTSIVIIQ